MPKLLENYGSLQLLMHVVVQLSVISFLGKLCYLIQNKKTLNTIP